MQNNYYFVKHEAKKRHIYILKIKNLIPKIHGTTKKRELAGPPTNEYLTVTGFVRPDYRRDKFQPVYLNRN